MKDWLVLGGTISTCLPGQQGPDLFFIRMQVIVCRCMRSIVERFCACCCAEGGRGGLDDASNTGGKRGIGGFLHSVRDVATRVVDDTSKEFSKIEKTLGQVSFPFLCFLRDMYE